MKAILLVLGLAATGAWGVEEGAESVPDPVPETLDETPRERYNAGRDLLAADDPEAAAEAFLAARDAAGPDPELRYRAAFNLGLALAAGVAADAPPEEAIETLRQSAAWFNDAVRLAPTGDDDARINLELISKRILALADQLNAGDRLEARLDRLIDDQRGIRDATRGLLADVDAEDAGTEPIGFKTEFDALAGRERALTADVGDSIDLAAEERLYIEQLPEAERTPEQQGRAYQLAGVTDYLERARQSLSDARRLLRRFAGERAHRRADTALAEMKRAREQLLDPVTVLKAVARDELALMDHTAALAAFGRGLRLEGGSPPPWLTAKHLAERQHDAAARTGGVLGRFEAVSAQGPPEDDVDAGRALRAVAAAVPILDAGLGAMRAAITVLDDDDAAKAVPEQEAALGALRRAIEEFAGVRELIELAYAGQQGIMGLLTPEADSALSQLSTAQRAGAIGDFAAANVRRLTRLEGLLAEEAAAAATEEVAGDDAQAEDDRDAQAQRYARAETLRADALTGLASLTDQVSRLAEDAGTVAHARTAAEETLAALVELRRLFFSIVEHLRELHAEQSDTHDSTATLQFEASADGAEELTAGLGLAAERQSGHADLADALAAALAQQADAASAEPAQSPDGEGAAKLAEAAEEVRQAGSEMQSAAAQLVDAAGRAGTMSPEEPAAREREGPAPLELEPTLTNQIAAIEHLENALRVLVPPDQGGGTTRRDSGSKRNRNRSRTAVRRCPSVRRCGACKPFETGRPSASAVGRKTRCAANLWRRTGEAGAPARGSAAGLERSARARGDASVVCVVGNPACGHAVYADLECARVRGGARAGDPGAPDRRQRGGLSRGRP